MILDYQNVFSCCCCCYFILLKQYKSIMVCLQGNGMLQKEKWNDIVQCNTLTKMFRVTGQMLQINCHRKDNGIRKHLKYSLSLPETMHTMAN